MDYKLREDLEHIVTELSVSGVIAGAAVAGIVIKYGQEVYDKVYGEANRACANLGGSKGRICRKNYNIQATKAEIQALKYARSQKCRKDKDPKACVQKINERIKKLEAKRPEVQYKVKESFLKRLNSPEGQKSIEYDNPKKFKFRPPGVTDPHRYSKGAKPKFKPKTPGIKEGK